MADDQLFIEQREQGDYAIRRGNSQRASGILPTQAEAIQRAREMNPTGLHRESVRFDGRADYSVRRRAQRFSMEPLSEREPGYAPLLTLRPKRAIIQRLRATAR